MVSGDAVRAQLERILGSRTFSGSQRQSAFLRVTVEKTLDGQSSELKESLIGLAVYGRKPGYDPRIDPIVRVEANRLRQRLEKYYAKEGQNDPIVISFPRPGYVPEFHEKTAQPAAQPASSHRNVFRLGLVLGAVAVAGVIAVAAWMSRAKSTAPNHAVFTRVTDHAGENNRPSISPDGTAVVYHWLAGGKSYIYFQRVGSANPVNLTPDSGVDRDPVFSPDGSRIAFRSERDGGGLFLMGPSGESVRRITAAGYHPAWSPDASELVVDTAATPFPLLRTVVSRLWRVQMSTGASRAIETLGDAAEPNWSPHGCRIAYARMEGPRRDVITIPAAGARNASDLVRITNDGHLNWCPVWSPDGNWLYFASNRSGTMNLWRIPVDECSGAVRGDPEQVTRGSAHITQPSLARNGQRIAYRQRTETGGIEKIGFDPVRETITGKAIPLTRRSTTFDAPIVSPDGRQVLLRSADKYDNIWVMGADGEGLRQITDDPAHAGWPRWSPDGSRIAFESDRGGEYHVWLIHPDGSGLDQLTTSRGRQCWHPAWAPDGTRIAYMVPDEGTFVIDMRDRNRAHEKLPPLPNSEGVFKVTSWSPDGKLLVGEEGLPHGKIGAMFVFDWELRSYRKVIPSGRFAKWLSDNRRVLYNLNNRLWLADTSTGRTREVLALNPGEITTFSIAPNDRTIFYDRLTQESNIWVMDWK